MDGLNGKDGAVGPAGPATSSTGARGPAGKDGVTKYVIVHPDGSQETVPTLPHTGSDRSTWIVAGLALGLVAAGTCVVLVSRRRTSK